MLPNLFTKLTLITLIFAPSLSLFAQKAGAGASGSKGFLLQLPVILGMIALFYFLAIRPQRQQQKKHQTFIETLKLGNDVVTSSGIIGKIRAIEEKIVTLEICQATEVQFLKSQIQSTVDLKALAAKS